MTSQQKTEGQRAISFNLKSGQTPKHVTLDTGGLPTNLQKMASRAKVMDQGQKILVAWVASAIFGLGLEISHLKITNFLIFFPSCQKNLIGSSQ